MDRGGTVVAAFAAGMLLSAALWAMAGPPRPEGSPGVIRASRFQLVDDRGRVRAELHLGPDGSGNLRLFDGADRVRVKLGTSVDRSTGLLLLDDRVEPAVQLSVDRPQGPRLDLSARSGTRRTVRP